MNNNVGEKYLPLGTVVMLKGASKRLMITGFCTMAADKTDEMYDYAGCMYPEGFLSSEQTALFNHEQIEKVYHMGLVDEEEIKFKNTLSTILNKINGEKKEEPVVKQTSEPISSETQTINNGLYQQPSPTNDVPTLEMPIYGQQQDDNSTNYF